RLFTGLPRPRRRLGPRPGHPGPAAAAPDDRPSGRPAHRRPAPRPAHGGTAPPARHLRGPRRGRRPERTGPAHRPVVRRLPRRLRGALGAGPTPGGVPVTGGARGVRPGGTPRRGGSIG